MENNKKIAKIIGAVAIALVMMMGLNVTKVLAADGDVVTDDAGYRRYFDTVYYCDSFDRDRWGFDFRHWPVNGRASAMAMRAIDLTEALEGFLTYDEYGKYFLPIKKAAGDTYSIARARGDISLKVRNSLAKLRDTISLAIPFIESGIFEIDYAYRLAVEFDTLWEELNSVLTE